MRAYMYIYESVRPMRTYELSFCSCIHSADHSFVFIPM